MNLDEAIHRLRRCLNDQVESPIARTGARVVDADVLATVLNAIESRNAENWLVEVVVPEDGDPAPDVGPDPVVLPRAAVCNNWERWTEDE